jgi:hypothetical protein
MFRFALAFAAVLLAAPSAQACAMYMPDDRDIVAALNEIDAAVDPVALVQEVPAAVVAAPVAPVPAVPALAPSVPKVHSVPMNAPRSAPPTVPVPAQG